MRPVTLHLRFSDSEINACCFAALYSTSAHRTALLDRLTHHCHILETGNDSYRLKHSTINQGGVKGRKQKLRHNPALRVGKYSVHPPVLCD